VQNNVTSEVGYGVVEGVADREVTDVALKTYVVVATFTRSVTVRAVSMTAALSQADHYHEVTISHDDSMNLLNWNAYEAD
jgi:hypothetical protein